MDWLSDHRPPRRDLLAALAFAVVWFGGIWFARHHGWYPVTPRTYYRAGGFTVGVLLTRASFPRTTLLVAAAVYPLFYDGVRLQTEFHLLPILLAAYTAVESSRVSTAWAAGGHPVRRRRVVSAVAFAGRPQPAAVPARRCLGPAP